MNYFQVLVFVLFLAIPSVSSATIVRIQTAMGVIDMQLFDADAPATVTNFLSYVNNGAYNNSFIHRSESDFVIQGGGYMVSGNAIKAITANAPVVNEFSPQRSNVRGTVAMAKTTNNPNSATNQWFVNLTDNSANLDNQNGGFTVFAKVMDVVDRIAQLSTVNAGSVFAKLPVRNAITGSSITVNDLVILQTVTSDYRNVAASDSDRLFAYLEAFYPEYIAPANSLSPSNSGSGNWQGYYYRYYSSTNAYIATANGLLYYMGPASNNQIAFLGTVSSWLAQAIAAGY
ncbi:MAG: peptidylprolyl isomerase [Methylobacter sp.]